MTLCRTILVFVMLLLPFEASAQLEVPKIVVAARAVMPIDVCESVDVCELASEVDLGRREFLISQNVWGGVFFNWAEFSLSWPDGWTVTDWTSCSGEVTLGDPTVNGERIRIELDEPHFEASPPLLRVVFDCPTPGRLSVDYHDSDQPSDGSELKSYVEVGDYCGRLPIQWLCEGRLCEDYASNLHFKSVDLRTTRGSIVTDTISVRIGDHDSIPECGSYDGLCGTSLETDVPWIEAELLSFARDTKLVVTARTENVGVGNHSATVYMNRGSRGDCSETCMPVSVEVLALAPVLDRSWGVIKAKFR